MLNQGMSNVLFYLFTPHLYFCTLWHYVSTRDTHWTSPGTQNTPAQRKERMELGRKAGS